MTRNRKRFWGAIWPLKTRENKVQLFDAPNSPFNINPEGKIIWIGPSGEENDDVIRQAQSNRTAPKHDLIVGKMMEWLFDEDLTCIEIYRRAKELGISVRTVDRVKAELKIKYVHKAEGWYWHLDSEAKNACENKQENGSDNFQESNPGTIQPQD